MESNMSETANLIGIGMSLGFILGCVTFIAITSLPVRFKDIFYRWREAGEVVEWWHGRAYYDVMMNRHLMVIIPFNWIINWIAWLNHKWCVARCRESWIDKKVQEMRQQ
ncbi:MAG: hypothetical protein Unbinned3891contig1000_64 [Prokaryotic dsDNA virus sp.]|mgnify:CR=1 FL=1|nr:MAG: hypothetical protein Unbinned3891contig1000_64 [Prokaryotic dsDNA virus sp.]|tara:strand:- start:56273 stop:56599 length:327 start_codon:yes stop_codon:yes gene_type:complete